MRIHLPTPIPPERGQYGVVYHAAQWDYEWIAEHEIYEREARWPESTGVVFARDAYGAYWTHHLRFEDARRNNEPPSFQGLFDTHKKAVLAYLHELQVGVAVAEGQITAFRQCHKIEPTDAIRPMVPEDFELGMFIVPPLHFRGFWGRCALLTGEPIGVTHFDEQRHVVVMNPANNQYYAVPLRIEVSRHKTGVEPAEGGGNLVANFGLFAQCTRLASGQTWYPAEHWPLAVEHGVRQIECEEIGPAKRHFEAMSEIAFRLEE